jgi:magnesium transporter
MVKTFQLLNTKTVVSAFDSANIFIYIAPTEEEKKALVGNYNIDEHTLSSSLDPDELARLEFEPDHIAMIVKIPKPYSGSDKLLFRVSSLGMFLFKDKLIVVIGEDIDLIRGKHFNKANTLNDVMLKIIFSSILHFIDHLKTINLLSDEI